MVLALVAEQWRVGVNRAADKLSNLEALVLSKGMAGAAEIRNQGAKQLGKLVDQYQRTVADIAGMRAELGRLDEQPVTGMNSDVITVDTATERMQAVAAMVQKEHDAGSLKHRRVASRLHRLITTAALLDFPVLPLTSVVFAILGTAAVAVGLHFLGRDLKGCKDEHGHIQLPEGKARIIPLVYIGLAVTVAIGAGIVMAYRIVSDSLAAGNGITSAVILGSFFAVIVIVVNVVVFSAYYRDGSLQTDEIGRLAAQLEPIEAQRVALQHRIDQIRSSAAFLVAAQLFVVSPRLPWRSNGIRQLHRRLQVHQQSSGRCIRLLSRSCRARMAVSSSKYASHITSANGPSACT